MVYKRAKKALSPCVKPRLIINSVIASISIHILTLALLDKYAPSVIREAIAPVIVSLVEEPPRIPGPPVTQAPGPIHTERLMPMQPIIGQALPYVPSPLPAPLPETVSPELDFSDMPVPAPARPGKDGVRLLDPQFVGEYARRAEQEHLSGPRIGISTDEFKYMGYMRNLKARIEGIWRYPREASERGISGDLYIEFTINRDGSLGPVRLARTSGYPVLDQAAMKALRDSAPFWPMPPNWEDKGIIVMGQFIYLGHGSRYLR